MDDEAISEIIGSILLIGIIATAVMIFSALYLPTIEIHPQPKVALKISCDRIDVRALDIDYPCDMGIFACPDPAIHPCRDLCIDQFNDPGEEAQQQRCINRCQCEDECRQRYSFNSETISERDLLYSQCVDNCFGFCSDPNDCRFVYICHNGGDDLIIERLKILVNGNQINQNRWFIKSPKNNINIYSVIGDISSFSMGDSILIPLIGGEQQVNDVAVGYSLTQGGEIILTQNLFGQ